MQVASRSASRHRRARQTDDASPRSHGGRGGVWWRRVARRGAMLYGAAVTSKEMDKDNTGTCDHCGAHEL